MTRAEYNELRYIKNSLKNRTLKGATLLIRVNASTEYKKALHELYTSLGFHPASIRVNAHLLDENERIYYIKNCPGWETCYTEEEKASFKAALN